MTYEFQSENSCDGPEPVRAANREVLVTRWGVDEESLVLPGF